MSFRNEIRSTLVFICLMLSGLAVRIGADESSDERASEQTPEFPPDSPFGTTTKNGAVALGLTEDAIPGKKWICGQSVIIAFAEDGTKIFGYCQRHPRWEVQKVESLPGVEMLPVVGDQTAAVQYGPYCFAYSTALGKWDTLKLPNGEAAKPTVNQESVHVESPSRGNFIFHNTWGKWFSAGEIKGGKVAKYLDAQLGENRETTETVQIFNLKYTHAADASRMIGQIYRQSNLKSLSVDERTNSMIVRAKPDIVAEIAALLVRLDKGPENPIAGLQLAVPAIGPEPIALDMAANPQQGSNQIFTFSIGIHRSGETIDQLRKKYRDLDVKSRELAIKLRGPLPDPGTGEGLRKEVRETVQQAFAARQQLQREELSEFARRLKKIEQSIEMREKIGPQIIDRHVQELLDPSVNWDEPNTGDVKTPALRSPKPDSIDDSSSLGSPRGSPVSDDDHFWHRFGARFQIATTEELPDHKYRCGLRITEIRQGGPAETNGIKVGDILVGIHVWEIASLKNLNFAWQNTKANESVKFHIVRPRAGGAETLFGNIRWGSA